MSDAPSPAFKPRQHDASEFEPLPFYSWLERPLDLPIDFDEAATALYLDGGDVKAAASRLKVTPARLAKLIRRSPRLQRLQADLRP